MNAPPRRIEAVIFDMDGLLCDTEAIYRDAFMECARDFGRDMPLAVFLSMIGTTDTASRAIVLRHFGPDFDVDAYWAAVRAHASAHLAQGAPLKAGAREILDDLDALALPRAICTSSAHAEVRMHLGPSGILARFAAVIARGDYAHGKPAPDPYLAAAAALGVAPEACLALEDSHNGVRSAHAAGMMTVMVPDLLDATGEIRACCAHVMESLHGVRALLRG
ncbi:MAG: HAD family hydrolase [Hyphomonadaceae bacterium]